MEIFESHQMTGQKSHPIVQVSWMTLSFDGNTTVTAVVVRFSIFATIPDWNEWFHGTFCCLLWNLVSDSEFKISELDIDIWTVKCWILQSRSATKHVICIANLPTLKSDFVPLGLICWDESAKVRERERERDDDAVGKMCISSLQHSCKSRHQTVTSVLITFYFNPSQPICVEPLMFQ